MSCGKETTIMVPDQANPRKHESHHLLFYDEIRE